MKRIRRFVETNPVGTLSKMQTMGGTFHAVRINDEIIFGVVELENEQIKLIDMFEDITLLPQFGTDFIMDSVNHSAERKGQHLLALISCGVDPTATSDEAMKKMMEVFNHPEFQ